MTTLQYVVNAIDGASGTFAKIALGAEDLNHKIDELGKKSAMAKVGLEGDKAAQASLKDLDLKLTRLKAKVTDPEVSVKGLESAYFGIGRLDVALDKIGAKHVTATVDVKVNRSGLLKRLLAGRVGGLPDIFGAGGGDAGGGPLAGGLTSPVGIGAIGGAGLLGAGLVPGVVGLGLGGVAGLGAIAGGVYGAAQGKKVLAADLANIKTITTSLKTAIGQQKKDLSQALKDANKQYAKDAAFFQPFTNFQDAIKGLEKTIIAPLRPIMAPLTQLFVQFGKGLTALGPQFTALFKASLPFIGQFLKFMLQAGKILLPAFTQALNQMVKSGALKAMTDALVVLTQGLATFIVNLGPGMAASAQIFAKLMTWIGRTLGFLGILFSDTAKFLTLNWSELWHGLSSSAKAFFGAVINSAKAFGHAMASSFDALRHDISTIWDTIWRNTVTRVRNGIHDVVGFFLTVPGRVIGALMGLGTALYNFAHQALTKMWNGFKAVATSIFGWFGTFIGKILGFFSRLLHHSPTGDFYHMGRNMMEGLAMGIKDHAHLVANASKAAASATAAGTAGAGVQQWRGLVLRALAMEHLPSALVNDVLYQMQTESGGNSRAINLTDSNAAAGHPSKGLMQTIDSTFSAYHWPGTSWNIYDPLANIAAAINYGAHNGRGFGSGPGQIGSGHGYDRGGWLPPGLSLAWNNTGRPEPVLGPGEFGHTTVNINVNVPPGTNKRAVAQEIADVLMHHTKAGGRLYPQGTVPR